MINYKEIAIEPGKRGGKPVISKSFSHFPANPKLDFNSSYTR